MELIRFYYIAAYVHFEQLPPLLDLVRNSIVYIDCIKTHNSLKNEDTLIKKNRAELCYFLSSCGFKMSPSNRLTPYWTTCRTTIDILRSTTIVTEIRKGLVTNYGEGGGATKREGGGGT